MKATALIAEDEPLLAENLRAELLGAWPALKIVASVGDGVSACREALAMRPDMLFLDIRMPAMTGLDAAAAITEDWPDGVPLPLVVFVTAYDQYALPAFERAAVDYVLKPVRSDRLAQTVARLQAALRLRTASQPDTTALESTLSQLRSLLAVPGLGSAAGPAAGPAAAAPRLAVIQAGVGAAIHMVPVDEVLYFEAADKYVRVVTAQREHLIRLTLRELLPQLDPQRFWQVHRGTVVRADAIATATRHESGKVHLTLRGHADRLVASRLYAHLFRAM
jgi:DNA-binding LytR/AlgR family response regulator